MFSGLRKVTGSTVGSDVDVADGATAQNWTRSITPINPTQTTSAHNRLDGKVPVFIGLVLTFPPAARPASRQIPGCPKRNMELP